MNDSAHSDGFSIEEARQRALDDALRTTPLASTPPTLLPAVLTRVNSLRSAPPPRFHLAWIDYALSLFASGMTGLTWLLWQSISPLDAARARVQFAHLLKLSNAELWWPALFAGASLTLAALLAAAILFARARRPAYR